mmetsp:Transcript_5428/g.8245  ORF Transcript_5428/g.8245 Transcript_5428/m.8245 type:complete len:210 (-) Transcript_5428:666-1295(-)
MPQRSAICRRCRSASIANRHSEARPIHSPSTRSMILRFRLRMASDRHIRIPIFFWRSCRHTLRDWRRIPVLWIFRAADSFRALMSQTSKMCWVFSRSRSRRNTIALCRDLHITNECARRRLDTAVCRLFTGFFSLLFRSRARVHLARPFRKMFLLLASLAFWMTRREALHAFKAPESLLFSQSRRDSTSSARILRCVRRAFFHSPRVDL